MTHRISYKPYNGGNGKGNRRFSRGKWQKIITGLATSGPAEDTLMLAQFRLKDYGTARGMHVRFVRVYEDGNRDGTGDGWFAMPAGSFVMSHQHWVKGGPFTVDVEVRVPGSGKFTVAYSYGKTSR